MSYSRLIRDLLAEPFWTEVLCHVLNLKFDNHGSSGFGEKVF